MEDVLVPIMVVGMLFIGLPWLVFHYITKWKQAKTLTVDDERLLDDALRASEADIAKLQSKLRDARTRQSGIETRIDSANQRYRMREAYAGERTKDAFSRFDILEREADMAEGRADAMGMGNVKTLDEEIAELRTDKKIDAELEAMNAKIKAAGKKG